MKIENAVFSYVVDFIINCCKGSKICAPFKLLKRNGIYVFWIIFIVLSGLLPIWSALLGGTPEKAMHELENGIVYTFCMSVCAPFIPAFLIEMYINHIKDRENHFMRYKMSCVLLDALMLIPETIIWLGKLRTNLILQIIVVLLGVVFSLYFYCVSEMENNIDDFKEYDDKNYLEKEQRRMDKTVKRADDISGEDILNWRDKNEKNR